MEETEVHNYDSTIPDEVEKQLQALPDEVLLEVSSRARRIVYGRRDARRREGGEGARWLVASRTNCHKCPRCKPSKEAYDRGEEDELEKIHGPYWYLQSYMPFSNVRTTASGHRRSGTSRNRYIGRHLPADLAQEFGIEEGATPEQAGYAK